MAITITDITGYTQCSQSITFNLWCPCPPRFPNETGCGKLIKSYGVTMDGDSTMQDVITEIQKYKAIQVRCKYCHYTFIPGEVYI